MPTSAFETADSRRFWEAARNGKLVFQSCQTCGHVQHPPRYLCATCWSDAIGEIESSGHGTIESITVVRRAPLAALRSRVPYVAVAVVMDEGPRMIANLLGDNALMAQAQDRVEVCFEPDANGQVLPQFRTIAN